MPQGDRGSDKSRENPATGFHGIEQFDHHPHWRVMSRADVGKSVEFTDLAFECYQWANGVHSPSSPWTATLLELLSVEHRRAANCPLNRW
jgi:hypothetical protein